MTSSTSAEKTWGPLRWDGTVADMERCARDLRAAGAPPDAMVSVSFTSYLTRMVRARLAPPYYQAPPSPPPTAEEMARRQRAGRRASRGLP